MNLLLIMMLILTILLTTLVIGNTILTPVTKEKKSFTMFMVSVFMFQIGYLIEITTFQKSVVMAGVKVQYVAICLILIFLTWFIAEFCKIHVSAYFYLFQFVFGILSIVIVFTSEYHHLMYLDLFPYWDGPFILWNVVPGFFYYLFYLNFSLVFLYALVFCILNLFRTKGLHKKRNIYILLGTMAPIICLDLRLFGLTNGYDVLTFGLFIGIILYYLAIVKFGYFTSLQAANVNVINHCKEGLLILNVQNEIIFANPVMEKIMPEIKVGVSVEEYPTLKDLLEKDETISREIQVEQSIYEIRLERLSEYGYNQGKLVWFIDLTQNYEYINQLKRLKQFAEQENQDKSLFFARMSHEIRTPMNVILGMDEMILRETESDTIREYAENISRVGSTLLTLINDLLDLTKLESGKMEITPTEYQLCVILNDILNMSRAKILEKKLRLSLQINPNLPSVLYGDEIRIRQVFLNIVNNAIKYTEQGQVTFSLDYEYCEDDSIYLIAKISDTGIGIKQEDMTKLFFEFQRLDPVKNKHIEGSGLGLIITKQLLNMMGGSISLESEYGKGSTFTIRLKQRIISDQKIGFFSGNGSELQKNYRKYTSSFLAEECRILVVDDSPLNLEVVKGLLKETKIQIDTALSGKECLEKMKQQYYHLLLIDHMMPEMSGTQTMEEINRFVSKPSRDVKVKSLQEWYLKIPYIVFTADHISHLKDTYKTYGFTDYIPKPITPHEFEEKIRESLPKEMILMLGPSEEKIEQNVPLPMIPGLDLEAGLYYLKNNRAQYLEVLKLYLKLLDDAPDQLYELSHKKNWKDYEILVHGIKSASINVGAIQIQKTAWKHEVLAKEQSEQELFQIQAAFIMELKQFTYELKNFFQGFDVEQESKIKTEKISNKEMQKRIQNICEDEHIFEEGVLKSHLEELLTYQLDQEVEDMLRTCLKLSGEYEIGAAIQLLKPMQK